MTQEVNVPLLIETLWWAEEEAKKPNGAWDQNKWCAETECGTVYCFAGYAVLQSGLFDIKHDVACNCSPGCPVTDTLPVRVADGEIVSFRSAGVEALGITYAEASDLFEGSNSIETVRNVVNRIIDRAKEDANA